MWRMVVSEQLARSQGNGLRALVTLQRLPSGLSRPAASLIDLVLVVTLGALVLAARRVPVVRVPLALLVASVAVLLAAPSFFVYYADYLTPAIALCVATGAAAVGAANFETHQRSARAYAVAGAVVIALLLAFPASALWYRPGTRPASLSSEQLASAVFDARCMMSDSPMALIELNALDDSLADGCPDWVDVSGRAYAPDMAVRGLDGRRLSRSANPRWQQAVRDYLLSGDAVILLRADEAGISPATQAAIDSGAVLGRDRTHIIYSVGREIVRASGA
jgi:hypothetical protein